MTQQDDSMQPPSAERHHLFTELQTDVVTKSDGRYILYYHWPTQPGSRASSSDEHNPPPGPPAEPWSPETRPHDA